MSITVNHKFVSPKAEQSDPTIVGPNEWNAAHGVIDTSNTLGACDYNFTAQNPGGNLIVGSNPINFNPVPPGLAIGGYLYISGGTGTAEAVPITGISGNIVSVTCANTHTGAWTIQSASGGLQEAIAVAPAAGSKVVIACNITLRANVVDLGKNILIEKFPGVAISNIPPYSIYDTTEAITADQEIYTTDSSSVGYQTSGPNWPTNYLNYAGLRMNVNNYPNYYFGSSTVAVPEAIRGSINIPANDNGVAHGAGVAGYSITNSTGKASLGVYGFGSPNVDGASCFGGNFVVSNRLPGPGSGPNIGTDNTTCYGIEVDINISQKSGGVNPNHSTRGIFLTGGSTATDPAHYIGIDIESPGVFQTPKLKWSTAIRTVDGAAIFAMDIGCTGVGNSVGSQSLVFRSRDSGGVARTAQILTDQGGNLLVSPGGGAALTLTDGSLNTGASVLPLGSNPYFAVAHQLNTAQGTVPATAASAGITGSISWDSSFIYVCIATNTWKRSPLTTW